VTEDVGVGKFGSERNCERMSSRPEAGKQVQDRECVKLQVESRLPPWEIKTWKDSDESVEVVIDLKRPLQRGQ
jgi:hypothetical protein